MERLIILVSVPSPLLSQIKIQSEGGKLQTNFLMSKDVKVLNKRIPNHTEERIEGIAKHIQGGLF